MSHCFGRGVAYVAAACLFRSLMWVKMKFENQMCCECIKIRLMVKEMKNASHICYFSVIHFTAAWFVLMMIAAKKIHCTKAKHADSNSIIKPFSIWASVDLFFFAIKTLVICLNNCDRWVMSLMQKRLTRTLKTYKFV
jgi:hypothetical protein